MDYELKKIDADKFAVLARIFSGQDNFAQSAEMGEARRLLGWQVSYLALFRGEEAVCVGMAALSDSKAPVLDFFCGPLGNLADAEVCQAWTRAVRAHARELRAASLHSNPNIVYRRLDPFGLPLEQGGEDSAGAAATAAAAATVGQATINNLRQAGWSWEGLTIKSAQPRFLYKLDLLDDYQSNFKSFAVSVRTATRRARENALTLRRVGREELNVFKRVLEETAERQGFADRELRYYQALYDAFGTNAHFMLVDLHPNKLRQALKSKIASLSQARDEAHGKGRKQQLSDQIAGAEKLLRQAEGFGAANSPTAATPAPSDGGNAKSSLPGTAAADDSFAIAICAGLFIRRHNELIYLFGGTRTGYLSLNAVYLLQEHMMQQCLDWGLRRYNFYGISGAFDPADSTYGVLAFKQAFGGYIEELIGDFSIILSPLRHNANRLAGRLRRLAR
ncbi:MAG: aminoacyltransferase [Coriobacteriales bacterium]|jgi:alanine adding enzyme|nr:aminoacyltransferase [Coriobacteriales bacterium]